MHALENGTLLEPCWTVVGILLEHCWQTAGMVETGQALLTLLEQSWNLPATLVKPGTLLENHWHIAGTQLEPCEPLLERGETLLEFRWNLVAGTSG